MRRNTVKVLLSPEKAAPDVTTVVANGNKMIRIIINIYACGDDDDDDDAADDGDDDDDDDDANQEEQARVPWWRLSLRSSSQLSSTEFRFLLRKQLAGELQHKRAAGCNSKIKDCF